MNPEPAGSAPSSASTGTSSPAPSFWAGQVARWGAAAGIVGVVVIVLVYFALSTRESRMAVRTYAQLTAAVNVQDLDAVRAMCTARYLSVHPLRVAEEGGVVGFPRSIHKNFQAWREGDAVLQNAIRLRSGRTFAGGTVIREAPIQTAPAAPRQSQAPARVVEAPSGSCPSRRYCTQIGSCQEAQYYLANCSWGWRLDGDSDGVPCESLRG